MDVLLMCGGRGTRLDADVEKPLYEVGGRPMVDRVLDALAASQTGAVHAVGSPHAPATRAHLTPAVRSYVAAPGDGYVADLDHALAQAPVERPVLTVTADLPLLAGETVDAVLDAAGEGSLAVSVPAALPRRLGASVDTTATVDGRELAPTGVNVVGRAAAGEETMVSHDARLAVNVNRRRDAAVAAALLPDAAAGSPTETDRHATGERTGDERTTNADTNDMDTTHTDADEHTSTDTDTTTDAGAPTSGDRRTDRVDAEGGETEGGERDR